MIVTNVFIIFVILSKEKNFYKEILKKNIKRFKKLTIFLIILGFVLGPVGNYRSFSFTNKIFPKTLKHDSSKWLGVKIEN